MVDDRVHQCPYVRRRGHEVVVISQRQDQTETFISRQCLPRFVILREVENLGPVLSLMQ